MYKSLKVKIPSLNWRAYLVEFVWTVPVLVYVLPILLSGNGLLPGDYDMQVQMSEAARVSIMQFKQLPLWNPWVAGGVPLFADPQFGLFTPQTLFSLFFGATFAWKLTLALYFILAFVSMKKLSLYLTRRDKLVANLLGYIWAFSSFFALRAAGHFTFMLLSLLPLAVYFALRLKGSRRYTVYSILLLSYCFNAAMHYSSILILLVFSGVVVGQWFYGTLIKAIGAKSSTLKDVIRSSVKSGASLAGRLGVVVCGAIILVLPRIYLSYKYLATNSVDRSGFYEHFIGLKSALDAIARPMNSSPYPNLPFGFFEASAYVGILTVVVLLGLLGRKAYRIFKSRDILGEVSLDLALFGSLTITSLSIAVGGSIFAALRVLPLFSSMRVSTRWFIVVAFGILACVAVLLSDSKVDSKSRSTKLFKGLLVLATMEVVVSAFRLQSELLSPNNFVHFDTSAKSSEFRQEKDWRVLTRPNYYALTESTQNNRGQLVADNALVDTRFIPTLRCDEDEIGCDFVLSDNARITYWSPNRIVLQRTGPGDIELDMNPGRNWRLDRSSFVYPEDKMVDSTGRMAIKHSDDQEYNLKYSLL